VCVCIYIYISYVGFKHQREALPTLRVRVNLYDTCRVGIARSLSFPRHEFTWRSGNDLSSRHQSCFRRARSVFPRLFCGGSFLISGKYIYELHMYIHVYVYIYIYIYMCLCICICQLYICVLASASAILLSCVRAQSTRSGARALYVHYACFKNIYIYMYVCMYVCIFICIHVYSVMSWLHIECRLRGFAAERKITFILLKYIYICGCVCVCMYVLNTRNRAHLRNVSRKNVRLVRNASSLPEMIPKPISRDRAT